MPNSYIEHVEAIESQLAPYAFSSKKIEAFATGEDALRFFEERWKNNEAQLNGRTPISLERDRILYSDALRNQSDKYHVLFWGLHRVSRNYTTHTLRVAQVARSIAGRLHLNADLAEAIALGSKVGGVPFLHVAKAEVADWVQKHVESLDKSSANEPTPVASRQAKTRAISPEQERLKIGKKGELVLPGWIDKLKSDELRRQVQETIPWAAGDFQDRAYSSGQESYWLLATEPFQRRVSKPYLPQTLYGIWRHSLPDDTGFGTFEHAIELYSSSEDTMVTLSFSNEHLTHEAVVVRHADDITWVVENLSEANKAAAFNNDRDAVFTDIGRTFRNEAPPELSAAFAAADAGLLYTYFIDDLVNTSLANFKAGMDLARENDDKKRTATGVTQPSESQAAVRLSEGASRLLSRMKAYLNERVFSQERTAYRNAVLRSLSGTVLDILAKSDEASRSLLQRRALIANWSEADMRLAESRLFGERLSTIQACVDILATMSDREVYDLIGLD